MATAVRDRASPDSTGANCADDPPPVENTMTGGPADPARRRCTRPTAVSTYSYQTSVPGAGAVAGGTAAEGGGGAARTAPRSAGPATRTASGRAFTAAGSAPQARFQYRVNASGSGTASRKAASRSAMSGGGAPV